LNHLNARLTSRMACGLVVGLELLSPPSRLTLLRDRAQRRQLAICPDVLALVAGKLGGSGRQLLGALGHLEALARQHRDPLDIATVEAELSEYLGAGKVTVERITQRVGNYFQVDVRQLISRRRYRSALLPRQVGMYLARQLSGLSLEVIGSYFGGRDHSTVLHACRKVEQALDRDTVLSGALRQLHAELA